MRTIEFLDDVTISRANGKKNAYGVPERDVVYIGKCNYQEGRVNTFTVITRRPKVFLPELVVVEINDHVEVRTHLGRKITGLVDVPRDIEMPLHKDIKLVELELKQAQ